MKIPGGIVLIWIVLVVAFARIPASAVILIASGVRVDRFKDDAAEDASVGVTIPLGLRYAYNKFLSFSLESAYNRTEQGSITLSSFTDALARVSYIIPKLPLPVMVGVMVNLPTGQKTIEDEEKDIMDEDAEVDDAGQGLNIGFLFSGAKKYQNWTIGLNGQYAYKGEYDPTDNFPDDDFDPGDHLLVNAKVQWKASSALNVGTSFAYMHVWPDTVGGDESFQEGSTTTLRGNLQLTRQPFTWGLNAQYIMPAKSKYLETEGLKTEPDNSKGRNAALALNGTYTHSQRLMFQAMVTLQHTTESPKQEAGVPYVGKRVQYSLGPRVIYSVTPALSSNVSVAYLHTREDANIYTEDAVTTHGLKCNLGISYTF